MAKRILYFIVSLGVVIIALTVIYRLIDIDQLKLSRFAQLCADAEEKIYKKEYGRDLAINTQPWSGIWQEDGYKPSELANDLLSPPDQHSKLQIIIDVPSDKAVPSCVGRYIYNINLPKEAYKIPSCFTDKPNEGIEVTSRHTLLYEYGEKNLLDIVPFKLSLINTKTKDVLAQQSTFMLLLGGMRSAENRRLYGWGSAQGAKLCKLTPPKKFINSVLIEK